MKITAIEPYENNRFFKVFLDGNYAMSLAAELIEKNHLCVGGEVCREQLKGLEEDAQVRRARERLLYSLDRRPHSTWELRQKLRRDYPPQVIDSALEQLTQLGLLDDLKFAWTYAEQQLRLHRRGPYAIRQLLYQKGVEREIVDQVLEELFSDEDSELSAAKQAAEKYRGDLDTRQGRQRAYAYLARRGFGSRTIREVLREMCAEDEFSGEDF